MAGQTAVQIEWVARVLGVRMAQAGGPSSAEKGSVVRLAQAMLLWNQTRSHVGQQVKLLQKTILARAADEPDYEDIVDNIGNLEEVLEILDDRLSDKLNALRGTTDAAEKQKLSDEARDIVLDYRSDLEDNELVNGIDHNGFVQLDIKTRLTATLNAVMGTI